MNEQVRDRLLLATAATGALLAARAMVRARRAYDVYGKTVLITGGSRGLGLVLARQLAREGARLAICARDAAELERARADLSARGADVLAVPCDLTKRAQVEELVNDVRAHFGRIDVLINNAGVIQVGPIDVMTLDDYEEAMRTHYWGPLYAILAVLPEMRERGEGRIVNISSVGGKISVPHLLPYSASKFALTGLSEGLRAALVKDGVYVTTVCPGLMRTGSPRNANFKGQHRAEYAWFSISDNLPVMSISAERAARRIIAAFKRGDAETTVSLPTRIAVTFYSVFPGLGADAVGLIERLLPGPDGAGTEVKRGAESRSALSPSVLTVLGDRAALRNNELR
jgi:short-subunit dehydrogenase